MTNLLGELQSAVLDPRDVELLLLSECGGCHKVSSGWIEYRTIGEVYARTKSKNGVISHLELGPGLMRVGAIERLLEKAKDSAAQTHGCVVASRVVFSARPLGGPFRWRDTLQLVPCPSAAFNDSGLDAFADRVGESVGLGADGPPYPMVLEVRVPRSTIRLIESARIHRELDRAQLLLTALITAHLGPVHWPSGRHWVSLKFNQRIENHLVQPGFNPGIDGIREEFLAFDCSAAELYEGGDYYDRLWPRDDALTLPATLATDLDHAAALSPTDAAEFQRACYWFALGIQHRDEPSLSIVCIATSIECLLPDEKSERCPMCNKPTAGPTRAFKQHLEEHGQVIPELTALRDKLYGTRSRLVHGSFASPVDTDLVSDGDEEVQRLLLELVAQRGLVSWLRDRACTSACEH